MSTEQTRVAVRHMVDQAMIAGDIDGAMATHAPGFLYHNPLGRTMGEGTSSTELMRQLIGGTAVAFPDHDYVVEALIADGDLAAVLYTWPGTNTGSLGGMAATERRVSATGAVVPWADPWGPTAGTIAGPGCLAASVN